MTLPRHPTTMENLPGEVLSEIFIRLLAKQLAQMRCICKSWNALLSDSSFVKSHLHRSIQNNDEILLFFSTGHSFDYDGITARPSHSPDRELTNFIKLPVNPPSPYSCCCVIGSVNGLICFKYGTYYLPSLDYVIHIWNPSLSAMLTLPPCSFPSADGNHFRFGFDPKTDDYKVVNLTHLFKPHDILPQVEVYSMRKRFWKSISQKFLEHIRLCIRYDELCVDGHDGHLHWLGYDLEWRKEMIVAFDLGAETFREISLPDSIQVNNIVLGVLTGKLCVMSKVEGGKCEVWVMDEYGVAESWVKHHVLQFDCYITPFGFTPHNEFLFRYNDNHYSFALHNPITTKTKVFKGFLGYSIISKVVEYVDSLVWVAPVKA